MYRKRGRDLQGELQTLTAGSSGRRRSGTGRQLDMLFQAKDKRYVRSEKRRKEEKREAKSKRVIKRLPLAVKQAGTLPILFPSSHAYLHKDYMQAHIRSSCRYIGHSFFFRGFSCLMTNDQWMGSWAGRNHLFGPRDRT